MVQKSRVKKDVNYVTEEKKLKCINVVFGGRQSADRRLRRK